MFGLPIETTLLVFGFPLFWIIYTAVFLYRTKHWNDGDTQQDDNA
jgi:hypothetical protein